ncbi:SAM-dependent methyltransferase [Candidatus Poriferisodalis sp.]|uniref:SAM-dependent methyltransferase n=1 Tax=Candidatus Poriferisodalis sp. TaxID=3101277 RepID=UPI003B01A3B9
MAGTAHGTKRFDAFMDDALYGPVGFYVRGGRPAARDGDFATSVELGSLFARCVASYLDQVWHELGRPDPFVIVEGGAGRGTLCCQVVAHAGDCRQAVQFVMVERVEQQRTEALKRVEALSTDITVTALADLPASPLVGMVIANELLDNLPFRLLERSGTGWHEVHVSPEDSSEVLTPAPADAAAMADALAPDAALGARVPLQLKAAVWVRRALRLLERGRLLIFDYGVPRTAELPQRPQSEWLRTYRSQRRGHNPLHAPGTVDITCDVAFDQLPPGATLSTQAEWLAAAGIESMTAQARARWQRGRSDPTAETLAARALLDEATALTDLDGIGAFWAAEWRVG